MVIRLRQRPTATNGVDLCISHARVAGLVLAVLSAARTQQPPPLAPVRLAHCAPQLCVDRRRQPVLECSATVQVHCLPGAAVGLAGVGLKVQDGCPVGGFHLVGQCPDLRDLFGSINVHSVPTADLDTIILPQEMTQIPMMGYGGDPSRGRERSRSGSEGRGSIHKVRASPIRVPPVAVAINSSDADIPIAEVVADVVNTAPPPGYEKAVDENIKAPYATAPTAPSVASEIPDVPVLLSGEVIKMNSPGATSSQLGLQIEHRRYMAIVRGKDNRKRQYFLRYWNNYREYSLKSPPIGELRIIPSMQARVSDGIPGAVGQYRNWRHIFVGVDNSGAASSLTSMFGSGPHQFGLLEKLRFAPVTPATNIKGDVRAEQEEHARWVSAMEAAARAYQD